MDHPTFAQMLGNYGEFVGAIAVVVTLVYLAGQLRQNTKALRGASYQAYNDTANSYLDFLCLHAKDLAAIDGTTPFDQLEPQAQMLVLALSMKMFNSWEATFLHHRSGAMDDDVFEGRKAAMHRNMNPASSFGGAAAYNQEAWGALRDNGFVRDFQILMEDIIASAKSASPSKP